MVRLRLLPFKRQPFHSVITGICICREERSGIREPLSFQQSRAKGRQEKILLEQETGYPWNGDIRLKITQGNQDFTMKLRIPGWVRGNVLPGDLYSYTDNQKPAYQVAVNGQTVESDVNDGYLSIARKWKKGDVVEVHFDMIPRIVKANPKVEADHGRVAVERGPIVYCAEWPDNRFNVHSILLNQHPQFKVTDKPELLYGIRQITTDAQALSYDKAGKLVTKDVELTLIPYYAGHIGAKATWKYGCLSM